MLTLLPLLQPLMLGALSLMFLHVYIDVGCEEGDVRLADGYRNNSGRVEFCHDGGWGTVCNDGWSRDETQVVCRAPATTVVE